MFQDRGKFAILTLGHSRKAGLELPPSSAFAGAHLNRQYTQRWRKCENGGWRQVENKVEIDLGWGGRIGFSRVRILWKLQVRVHRLSKLVHVL